MNDVKYLILEQAALIGTRAKHYMSTPIDPLPLKGSLHQIITDIEQHLHYEYSIETWTKYSNENT